MLGRKNGFLQHKLILGFILLTFIHAKWMKFKPTFVRNFNKIWMESLKDFLNTTFWSFPNFEPFHLVNEHNLLLCMNITLTNTQYAECH